MRIHLITCCFAVDDYKDLNIQFDKISLGHEPHQAEHTFVWFFRCRRVSGCKCVWNSSLSEQQGQLWLLVWGRLRLRQQKQKLCWWVCAAIHNKRNWGSFIWSGTRTMLSSAGAWCSSAVGHERKAKNIFEEMLRN